MRTLVSVYLLATLALTNPVAAVAGTSVPDGAHLALASCPDRADRATATTVGEPTQFVEDKDSTDATLTLLKEYLDFHGDAQTDIGARAALMPWSDLATHAN
jgi:hypothetical protein